MSVKKKVELKSQMKKKSPRRKLDEDVRTVVDYTPKNFVSRNLNLIPNNMSKAIEYLLYTKPSTSRQVDLLMSSRSRSSTGLFASNLQLKTNAHKSNVTIGDSMRKSRMADAWVSFTSIMGLDKKRIFDNNNSYIDNDHVKKDEISSTPSLFRIRTDPWPETKDSSKTFSVVISETPTFVLYFFRSRAAIEGTEAATAISENNEAYWARVKTYKKMYNVEAQTPFVTHSDRCLGSSTNTRNNAITQVCYSDIYDCDKKYDSTIFADTISTDGRKVAIFYDLEDKKKNNNFNDLDEFDEASKIVRVAGTSDFVLNSYNLLRSIDRNVNWRKQIVFKEGNKTDPLAVKCPITYDIEHLWTLRFLNVWGMPATCLCVNPVNPNIIAVGHGMYFMDQPQHLGRVCIWNFKNCSLPEKYVEFRDGVTSVSFPRNHPSFLLVSVISGTVMLVDISKSSAEVLLSCGGESTSTPVWQVRWFTFDSGNEEPVACSDDGNVYLISKVNFSKKVFLSLSRREGVVKGIAIPKHCLKPVSVYDKPGVMCIATNPDNLYNYLVGTYDGCVHLCSTDYWHEHTDVFQAHIGPVHHIKFHPDCSKIFLTVGIDYCVRIWAYGIFRELVNLSESDNAVEDADWSPVNPNILASIAADRVSLWDISRLKLVSQGSITSPTGSRFTSVNFTSNGSNLICGDVSGDVHVYSLSHLPFHSFNKGRVLRRTFKRILLGKKDLLDQLRNVGYPFDDINDMGF